MEERVRFERLLDMVLPLDVGHVVNVGHIEQLGDLVVALFGEADGAVLFVDGVIAGGVFFARFLALDLLAAHQPGDDAVDLKYLSVDSSLGPEMISGVRASSTRMESFFGIRNQHRLDLVLQQRIVELHRFFGRRAAIQRTADIERRRLGLVRVHDRAAREIFAGRIRVRVVEKQADEVWDVGDQMLRHLVRHRRHGTAAAKRASA